MDSNTFDDPTTVLENWFRGDGDIIPQIEYHSTACLGSFLPVSTVLLVARNLNFCS